MTFETLVRCSCVPLLPFGCKTFHCLCSRRCLQVWVVEVTPLEGQTFLLVQSFSIKCLCDVNDERVQRVCNLLNLVQKVDWCFSLYTGGIAPPDHVVSTHDFVKQVSTWPRRSSQSFGGISIGQANGLNSSALAMTCP